MIRGQLRFKLTRWETESPFNCDMNCLKLPTHRCSYFLQSLQLFHCCGSANLLSFPNQKPTPKLESNRNLGLRNADSFSFSNPKQISKQQETQYLDLQKCNSNSIFFDVYNCNQKISYLGRCRKVEDARQVFDKMPQRDVASWVSMITVYLKNGELPKAEQLFDEMPERNIVAESAMIDGYAKAGRIDLAREIFDRMPERNVYSWTSLIGGYCRAGQLDEAHRVFDRMPSKNIVSWTTMALGYARNGRIFDALALFGRMPEKNVVSWTAMISGCIGNGRIEDARKLFDEMPQRNLYSWNTMILGYLDAKRVNEACELFELMPRRNTISWTIMVTGLAENGLPENARIFFDRMPEKDIAAWNAMITAYASVGNTMEASEIFDSMPERNVISWNTMIDAYAKNGNCDRSFTHLISMLRMPERPNQSTLTSILTACESLVQAMQAHALTIRLGFGSDTSLTNALISTYSKAGDIGSAWLAFEKLEAKDVVSWTSMMVACAQHGCGELALGAFARMLRAGVQPDEITFVGVLSACSHIGKIEKGKKLFYSMDRAYGLDPRAEHYACMVDLLGRAGCIDEAKRLVDEMPGCKRDGIVLGSLLGACKLHGDIRLARPIGEELMELEPDSSGSYMLLSNVYAARGKWEDVAFVRKKMKGRNVKKQPGFSHIEVERRSHTFLAGDRSHPQAKEIYAMLEEELLCQMKEMGYKPEIQSFSM